MINNLFNFMDKMCGIFLFLSSNPIKGKDYILLTEYFSRMYHRGPDQSNVRLYNDNIMVGFHRLAVMGPDISGLQPFETERFSCIVNGEIYNYKYIQKFLQEEGIDINWKTNSDCEVVLPLFEFLFYQDEESCIPKLINFLDGEFSFIILDIETSKVYFGTDELSIRPLFIANDNKGNFLLSSEQKAIPDFFEVLRLPSAHYGHIDKRIWMDCYYDLSTIEINTSITMEEAIHSLRYLLIENVRIKLNTDREYGFLLSGGLDSSLICSIASSLLPNRIRTFTVGFSEDATDVLAARKVAKYINSNHTEYIFTYQEGLDIIPEVIYYNESWDQTTVRASVVMKLCVKKIKEEHPDIAVIYSGEVADELLMGYLYNKKNPSLEEGRKDMIMRLKDICYFDGLRADRVVSSESCELRLPFFGKNILQFVLSLPTEYLNPPNNDYIEKYLLRRAFEKDEHGADLNYLPEEILWRTKNAMSDATSFKSGWKEQIKMLAETCVTDSRFQARKILYPHCTPQTKEDMYYREIFEINLYNPETVPYKWMNKWDDPNATDSSASTIDVFNEDSIK